MENDLLLITWLNDFIFCPVSIYFHNLYGEGSKIVFQDECQINGTAAHERIDDGTHSTRAAVLSGITVFCEEYGLVGKIDIFDVVRGHLIERKKNIKTIYDGYVFQLYAQCYSLREMGYKVNRISLRSRDDNKTYDIPLPEDDESMNNKFLETIKALRGFDMTGFKQNNIEKCMHCIYEPLCDSSLL